MTTKRLKPSKSQQGPYSVEQVRDIMEDMIHNLNQKKIYSDATIAQIADDRYIELSKKEYLNVSQEKKLLEDRYQIAQENLNSNKEGLIDALAEISNLYDLQIGIIRYYEGFIDSYNERLILEALRLLMKKRKISSKKNKVVEKRIKWHKDKRAAVDYCLEIYKKDSTKQPKEICGEFLKTFVIVSDPNYTVEKLLNYFSSEKKKGRM